MIVVFKNIYITPLIDGLKRDFIIYKSFVIYYMYDKVCPKAN